MYSENDWRNYCSTPLNEIDEYSLQHSLEEYSENDYRLYLEHKWKLPSLKGIKERVSKSIQNAVSKAKSRSARRASSATASSAKKSTESTTKESSTNKSGTGSGKWTWPDGKNTPEYNHWYYENNKEKWGVGKSLVDRYWDFRQAEWWNDALLNKVKDIGELAVDYVKGYLNKDFSTFDAHLEWHKNRDKETWNAERLESKYSTGEIDKETGWPKQTANNDYKYDLARVNQDYDNWSTNTKMNCTLCTMTYDLRQRGYDVEAKVNLAGNYPDEIKEWYPDAKVEKTEGSKKLVDTLENDYPDGSRGYLCVYWPEGSGHTLAWQKIDGELKILDPQSNKVYDNPDDLLDRTNGKYTFARLDNVDFDPKAIKEVAKPYQRPNSTTASTGDNKDISKTIKNRVIYEG